MIQQVISSAAACAAANLVAFFEEDMMADKVDVAAVLSAIQEQNAGWTAGETTMTALSEREQRLRLGVQPPPGVSLDELVAQGAVLSGATATDVGAPAEYDLRNVGGNNFVTPVKNQGNCGSCVSFGTCGAIETTFRVQRGDPNLVIDLSEAHLFYCQGRTQGVTCATGWMPDKALTCARDTGITDEAHYPYTAGDQNCTGLASDWANFATKISAFHPVTNDAAAMKTWLSTRGALTACFVVYNDFFAYTNGVYRHVTGAQAGGHCVTIIGYSDARGSWICKNSWGTGWGNQGFFEIAYGECAIDTWQVNAVDGVVETGWINNTKIVDLWTIDQDRNAFAYVQGTGWRKVAFDSDNVFIDMLMQLVVAKSASRPVNVYQENGVIKQLYVL